MCTEMPHSALVAVNFSCFYLGVLCVAFSAIIHTAEWSACSAFLMDAFDADRSEMSFEKQVNKHSWYKLGPACCSNVILDQKRWEKDITRTNTRCFLAWSTLCWRDLFSEKACQERYSTALWCWFWCCCIKITGFWGAFGPFKYWIPVILIFSKIPDEIITVHYNVHLKGSVENCA